VITTEPLSAGLGVRVSGFTGNSTLDHGALREFNEILHQHDLVLCSIDGFTEEDQRRLAQSIGEITIRGSYDVDPLQPDTQYVSNTRGDGILGTGRLAFHHDHLFYERPLTALMLYAIEIPTSGSVTCFRSAADCYTALTPALRERVDAIELLHLYDYAKINAGLYKPFADPATASADAVFDYKPLAWRRPVSGETMLWLSPPEGFRGVEHDEGIAFFNDLCGYLDAHADEIGHLDHSWTPGDLVVWNNLTVAHARRPFDKSQPRTLRRTPIVGEVR